MHTYTYCIHIFATNALGSCIMPLPCTTIATLIIIPFCVQTCKFLSHDENIIGGLIVILSYWFSGKNRTQT